MSKSISSSEQSGKKILIIRFSSFGDIVFTMSALPLIKEYVGHDGQIDWLLRSDMAEVLDGQNITHQVFAFERKSGLKGLLAMSLMLRKHRYDIVYDAHANVRSFFARTIIAAFSSTQVVIRKKERWKRFLLFKLRINKFPWPFKGMVSFIIPLKRLGLQVKSLRPIQWQQKQDKVDTQGKIVLVPSAAWKMKRWPVHNWCELVALLPKKKFIILGGPGDLFCDEIYRVDPQRVENYAGKLSLGESCSVIARAEFVVTGDTGLAQVADLTGRKGLTLIGPTAFGFPSMGTMEVVEKELPCRPCTKDGSGTCSQDVYQKCMVQITPEEVAAKVNQHKLS